MGELGVFPIFFFLEKDLSKVDKILGFTFFKLYCLLDAMFTTPVYLRRRGRFMHSAFLNCLPNKQMTKKQMFAEILRFK